MNKTERITFRVTPEVKEFLQREAEKGGYTVAQALNRMIKQVIEVNKNE